MLSGKSDFERFKIYNNPGMGLIRFWMQTVLYEIVLEIVDPQKSERDVMVYYNKKLN